MSRQKHIIQNWLSAMVDPRRLLGALKLPRFFMDWRRYNRLAGNNKLIWNESHPCLSDWVATTPFDPHYFYQTHWAALKLARHTPRLHVDIGSSALFVATVSAFVPLIFVDYRPIRASVFGLEPLCGDLNRLPFGSRSIPSLSCLHVIEHVGLGRYGDRLDPMGSFKAALELVRVLGVNGHLLLSTPLGRARIQFNAHRVFEPEMVLSMFSDLQLVDFAMVDDEGRFFMHKSPDEASICEYACGMFEFLKTR